MNNNKDLMYISFKLKSIDETLKRISIKIDTLEQNIKIFQSDVDILNINKIIKEIEQKLEDDLNS